jgi:hypothetical protein
MSDYISDANAVVLPEGSLSAPIPALPPAAAGILESNEDIFACANQCLDQSCVADNPEDRKNFLLTAASVLLEQLKSEKLPNGPLKLEVGFKLATVYKCVAVEFQQPVAEKGLEIIEILRGASSDDKSSDIISLFEAQFNFLLGNTDVAKNVVTYLLEKYRSSEIELPEYSFQKQLFSNNYFSYLFEKNNAESSYKFENIKFGSISPIISDIPQYYFKMCGIGGVPSKGSETPYDNLSSETKFWKTAVAQRLPNELGTLYEKKFPIEKSDRIMSAGSCFAQHIGKSLKENGFNFMDYEPDYTELCRLAKPSGEQFGYNLYSARYGNIYTSRQLRQLFLRAFGRFEAAEEFWEQNGRYYDPFRPTIEPSGFYSLKEARVIRSYHLNAVKRLFRDADLLIFTLGLTECWFNEEDGAVYPLCPGTAAGVFDKQKHKFLNLTCTDVVQDLDLFIRDLKEINPQIKILLSVSPVPLVATASREHVLVATMKSKAILRAAVSEIYDKYSFVDYFPSYDIISSISFGRFAFAENFRQVKPEVVNYVMKRFFAAHGILEQKIPSVRNAEPKQNSASSVADEKCDELVLEALRK